VVRRDWSKRGGGGGGGGGGGWGGGGGGGGWVKSPLPLSKPINRMRMYSP